MAEPQFGDLRREYGDEPLRRRDQPADPAELFGRWLAAAVAAGVTEANGMALATCGMDCAPHCRIVLLKQYDARGLQFFTNRESDKGVQLAANPRAAATFWWREPRNRQVRIEGTVTMAADVDADRYFASRPREAQLASAASPQSREVADREALEALVADLAQRAGNAQVARPPHWGGYLLQPLRIEFWQGRKARLHDRFRYDRVDPEAPWRIMRLAP